MQSKQHIHILQRNTNTAMQLTHQCAAQHFESINYGKLHNSWIICLKLWWLYQFCLCRMNANWVLCTMFLVHNTKYAFILA